MNYFPDICLRLHNSSAYFLLSLVQRNHYASEEEAGNLAP